MRCCTASPRTPGLPHRERGQAGIRSATLNVWIKSNPKTQGKLQGWRRRLLASSSIKPPRGLPQNSACCAEYIITVHRAASSAAKPPVLKSIKYRVVRTQCVFSRGQRRAGSRVGQGAVPSPELAPPALRTALHSPPPHLPLLQYTPIHSNTPLVPTRLIPIHQPTNLEISFLTGFCPTRDPH